MNKTFKLALERLGFKELSQQTALLKIFSIAGYFSKDQIWQDLLHLNIEKASILWKEIYPHFYFNKASYPKIFHPESLINGLNELENTDTKFWEDYLLYIGQHAFARDYGKERYQILKQTWMEKYQNEYLSAAEILNLTNHIEPKREDYDEVWIAGASRLTLTLRLLEYKSLLISKTIKTSHTLILAGERNAWANIDGIHPDILKIINKYKDKKFDKEAINNIVIVNDDLETIEEGKKYLLELAKKENIQIDKDKPFLEYLTESECPKGFFPNRVYLNYAKDKNKKITETTIAQDLLKEYLPEEKIKINNTVMLDSQRPTTSTTAYNAAKEVCKRIVDHNEKKEKNVLLISNNPHIERQKIVAQKYVNKATDEFNTTNKTKILINLEGSGLSSNQNIPIIHSELGALLTEKWKLIYPEEKSEHLLYQTRNHEIIEMAYPDLEILGEDASTIYE